MLFQRKEKINVTERIDYIENEVYAELKKLGFRKHGRTLHRYVSGDISQVINFQCGQAYRQETHLMWVNIGIRVPECFENTFTPEPLKKYYHEYECNLRTRLGAISLRHAYRTTTYDLRRNVENIAAQIRKEILQEVMPVFEVLSSRDSILAHRRDYPRFDSLNRRGILLEECMIYGRRGELERAKEAFAGYYQKIAADYRLPGHEQYKFHLEYLDELAQKLGLR